MNLKTHLGRIVNLTAMAIPLALVSTSSALADSFTTQVFATGTAVSASAPDSVTVAGNSVWVEYGNGASSTGGPGNSTIVQYSMAGAVQNTYSLSGSVDGLKYNPNTGQIWALHNQDASSSLTIINPSNGQMTNYSYGTPYSSASGRGFDDVAFVGGSIFLSETNPASPSDPIIEQLTTPLNSPLLQTTVLTGTGLLATDPDSLKSTPSGGLILSGEGDHALTFINNPGVAGQTAFSISLVNASGGTAGSPDDVISPGATAGTFFVADTTANTVYRITGSGLSLNSLYGDVGGSFGSVNPASGLFTNEVAGVNFHGLDFVAAPEPSTMGIAFAGLAMVGAALIRRRRLK